MTRETALKVRIFWRFNGDMRSYKRAGWIRGDRVAYGPDIEALLNEYELQVETAATLRAKAESLLYVVERSPLFQAEGYDAEDVQAYMDELREALTKRVIQPTEETS